MRSRTAARASGLLLTLVVAAAVAGPAQARVTGVIPADADGPEDSFLANEILYATGVNNALEGAAQLCVVPAGHSGEGTCAEDGIWGRPNAIVFHGTFPPQPIVAPYLPPGTWRILADNGDGDSDPPDVVSDQFTVSPCAPADDCSTVIADAVMAEWKQTAGEAGTGMAVACLASSVYNGGGSLSAGSALLSSGARGAIMAEIKGDGVSLAFGPRQSQGAAVALLRNISCGAFLMYADIVADPPDPDYEQLAAPADPQLNLGLTSDASVADAAQILEETAAYGKAHRIGIERYQGAVQASDEGWAAVHAWRVGEQALETQSRMRRLGRRLDAAAVAVADPEVSAATPAQVDTAEAIRERVRVIGFTAAETAELEAEGLSESEIAQVRAQLGAPLPENVAPMSPDAALHVAADHVNNATCIDDSDLCGFDTMGRAASAAGASGAVPPTLSLTPLELRESDVGVNHARVRIELSHPSALHLSGPLEVTPQTTSEGEVSVPEGTWLVPPWRTRTQQSVVVVNDAQDEPTETAQLRAATSDESTAAAPVTVTVLDDDGPGDPQTRPRSQRGLIALSGPKDGASAIFFTEPDGTELVEVAGSGSLPGGYAGFAPNGRSLLTQNNPPTLSALQAQGTEAWRVPVDHQGRIAGEPVTLLPPFPWTYNPVYSPDSRRLAGSQMIDGLWKLVVMPLDAAGAQAGPIHITGDDPPMEGWWAVNGASFNPDRTRIAFTGCKPGATQCGIYVVRIDDAGAARPR